MFYLEKVSDVVDFSEMSCEEKEDLIENICQRQLNLASSVGGVEGFLVKWFIENIDVNEIKERLIGKLSRQEVINIILSSHNL